MTRHRNPVEDLWCRHCDKRGLRYQGTRRRPAGGIAKVYLCVHCGRRSHDPVKCRPAKALPAGPIHPYHDVPVACLQRWRRLVTMSWRAQ